MRDIKTFVKLFDLNVPEYQYLDYYIEQYSKLPRWSHLKEMINLYQDFESIVEDPYQYKVYKSNQIIGFLETTRAYGDLNDDNLIPDYPITKNFEYSEDKKYLSIDINLANWVVLKKYDPPFLNELGETYIGLLEKFDVHPVFFNSKQFRQYIFGNLNPKRQIKAQRVIIEDLVKSIQSNIKILCTKSDEVIFEFDDFKDISDMLSHLNKDLFKYRLFTVDRVDDFRVNSFYNDLGILTHKELSGCNGNKYFIYLKKYILNESLDIRDLYFRVDGDLAIWNLEELEIKL